MLSVVMMANVGQSIDRSFFQRSAPIVAEAMIGATLLVDRIGGIIIETEAYDHTDPASHSFGGRTARNASMFKAAGCAYIYRSYGIHWCLNAVCGAEPLGSAVLIRALQPTTGVDIMCERRHLSDIRQLCRGPGRLTEALGITGAFDGYPLDMPPFAMESRSADMTVVAGRRIGLTRGTDAVWRFGLSGSAFLSRTLTL